MKNNNNIEVIPTRRLLKTFKSILAIVEEHTGAIVDKFEYQRRIPPLNNTAVNRIELGLMWGKDMSLPEITSAATTDAETAPDSGEITVNITDTDADITTGASMPDIDGTSGTVTDTDTTDIKNDRPGYNK